MRNRLSASFIGLGALLSAASTSVAADTHVILATDAFQWSYHGKHSQITIIDDLKIGDILDIQVPEALKHKHGFITINVGPPITETEDPVLKCGETGPKVNTAPLKEDCAPGTKGQFGFNKTFKGSMKLIVTDKFKGDVPFYCVVHLDGMQGVLKLKVANAK